MSRKSSTGLRKSFTMPFILSLLVGGLILLVKSMAKGGQVNQQANPSNIPQALKEQVTDQFSYGHYSNAGNWLAVSKMETGGFTSGAYKNANNPWGMNVAKVRPNRQAGSYLGTRVDGQVSFNLASYDSLEDAVADLALWMDYTKFSQQPMTIQQHVHEMNLHGYFGSEPEEEYLAKVLAWENR